MKDESIIILSSYLHYTLNEDGLILSLDGANPEIMFSQIFIELCLNIIVISGGVQFEMQVKGNYYLKSQIMICKP